MNTKIYCLIDPRDSRIRYIGKTRKSLRIRLTAHASEARTTNGNRRHKWIRELLAIGAVPDIRLIEECEGDGNDEEQFHILLARLDKIPLLNMSFGGEGGEFCHPESAKRISEAQKRRWENATPQEKAARSEIARRTFTGRKWTEEHRSKYIASRTGFRHSEETRAKQSAAKAGKRPSDLMMRRSREATTGRKRSPEEIAKMVAKLKGQKRSEEFRTALSKRMLGKKWKPESIDKLRQSLANPISREKRRLQLKVLSRDQEAEIIGRYKAGETMKSLSSSFDCGYQTIYRTLKRNNTCLRGYPGGRKLSTATRQKMSEGKHLAAEVAAMEIVGHRFGSLTVICSLGIIYERNYFNCLCDCGNSRRVSYSRLMEMGKDAACVKCRWRAGRNLPPINTPA